jgi:hypothetical protein
MRLKFSTSENHVWFNEHERTSQKQEPAEASSCFYCEKMVGDNGFEPLTSSM